MRWTPSSIRDFKALGQISESCIECHPLTSLPASKERIRPYQAVIARMPSRTIEINLRLKPTSQRTLSELTEPAGIDWHMDPANRISFVEDAKGKVLWIESESPKNGKHTYLSIDTSRAVSELEALPRRSLSCTGCHNRLAHDFSPKTAMANAVNVVPATTATTVIATDVTTTAATSVAAMAVPAMAQTQEASLGFDASHYPNQLGHLTDLGCFRCHDGRHRSTRGTILSSDCATVCHSEPRVVAEVAPVAPIWASPARWHVGDLPNLTPEVIAHSRLLCNDCHSQSHAPKHPCEDCHHAPGLDKDSDVARRPDG